MSKEFKIINNINLSLRVVLHLRFPLAMVLYIQNKELS